MKMLLVLPLILLSTPVMAQFEGAKQKGARDIGELKLPEGIEKILAIDPNAPKLVSGPQFRADIPGIDPFARDLLARLTARYLKYVTFSTLVEVKTSQPVPWTYNRMRLQMDNFRARVVTAEPGRGATTEIFDGRTVLKTNTRFPRLYSTRQINAERFSLRVFLKNAGADFLGLTLLNTPSLGGFMVDPDLDFIQMGEVKDGLQCVVYSSKNMEAHSILKLWIEPKTLELHRVESNKKLQIEGQSREFSYVETYSEIAFDAPLAPSLFQTTPPAGFKPVSSFDSPTVAVTAPIKSATLKP